LSTLTKVLIVLLTVFSIFLCGIVVTYVANAENQRARADGFQRQLQSARESQRDAVEEADRVKQAAETSDGQLKKEITALTTLRDALQSEIANLKRENSQMVTKLADAMAVVETANATTAKMRDQVAAAETEVKNLRTDQANRNKELQETTQALMERMAVIADLEKKNRQLVEEKQGLSSQLSQTLQQYGRAPVRPRTVTSPQTAAQPVSRTAAQPTQTASMPTKEIGLNARVTQVDMKNKVAAISIGSAAGVREDMKFHVTRGDRFICDILIFDVDPEKAIGILDLVQTDPQAGDLAATNL
jgi:myosin heavy subunit